MAWLRYSSVVLVMVLVSGCREAPPDRSRLTEGQEVIVFRKDLDQMGALVVTDKPPEAEYVSVDVGTRLLVLEDSGDEKDPSRLVMASVLEGKHKAVRIKTIRSALRLR